MFALVYVKGPSRLVSRLAANAVLMARSVGTYTVGPIWWRIDSNQFAQAMALQVMYSFKVKEPLSKGDDGSHILGK